MLVVHIRQVQGVDLGLRVVVGLVDGVVVAAELNGDAVVFKVCLVICHCGVRLCVVANSYGGDDKACGDDRYLRTGGVLTTLELVVFHAVHDTGGVHFLDGA